MPQVIAHARVLNAVIAVRCCSMTLGAKFHRCSAHDNVPCDDLAFIFLKLFGLFQALKPDDFGPCVLQIAPGTNVDHESYFFLSPFPSSVVG
jgi:hypothetical protein